MDKTHTTVFLLDQVCKIDLREETQRSQKTTYFSQVICVPAINFAKYCMNIFSEKY